MENKQCITANEILLRRMFYGWTQHIVSNDYPEHYMVYDYALRDMDQEVTEVSEKLLDLNAY